ncbi:branched-chain amino acid ABC transporter permease [Actinoplanes sp. SE50]|uniref:branched-chain amino acid ABC transporter permease n=1 Tax=unclassified Actinoplanes TaxID=2626549 RepID=UPI00023ECFF5|nr:MULTISPECIES: branched-chain amino acid ABC transporter permease [unclassified Actinoplanes]AEV82718.1 High-affinity branched-chain amino acid transport system permease protein livM [Actinoplanes sp. SE50/110]ATO81114.1 branched-chain amino acid ABC transporter permease [Actinoplanes sp. SE50]SLL98521.1 ABC-type BCAA transporter, permease component [Actinoplanes sp. SE50/110]
MSAVADKPVTGTPKPSRQLRGWLGRQPAPVRWAVILGFVVLAYLLPYVDRIPGIGPQIVTTGVDWPTALFEMSYYVLLALGLNVVVGFAGLLDLGYVGFFAVGAYVTALLTSPDSVLHTQYGWLVAIPASLAVTMLAGVLLGWPTLRLRGDYLAIVTLGFAEIIRIIATSATWARGDRGFSSIPHPPGKLSDGSPLFGVTDAIPYFWLGLSVVILVVLGVRNLDRSRVGRSWLAIREDEEAAEIMGVRTIKFKLWAFAIGAFIGGLGGVLFSGETGFINSQTFVLQFSILVLAGVVMGGSGNIAGAILGGALISYIPNRLRGIQDPVFHTDLYEYRFALFGAMIILIMVVRPQGLIPSRRRAMELKDREKEAAPQ